MTTTAPTLSRKARLAGMTLLALVLYFTLGAVVYAVSLVALQQGTRIDLPWFGTTQKLLYRNDHVNASNWLGIPGCIQPDPDLIYVPAIGTCAFDDIEFKTTLTFGAEGRETGPKPAGTGIAVIGDSHAMSWGADDAETFAAHLQTLSNTARVQPGRGQLRHRTRIDPPAKIRHARQGRYRRPAVLQQRQGRKPVIRWGVQTGAARQGFGAQVPPAQPNRLAQLTDGYGHALTAPFRSVSESLCRKNFAPHHKALMPVLERHRDLLAGKRVIVFYANPYGQRYRNFPSGPDATMPNIEFVDLDLAPADHRKLDNHMTPAGHRKTAERLYAYLQTQPAAQQD